MTGPRAPHRMAIAFASILLIVPSSVQAQDVLARAKNFYAAASYEEALAVLDSVRDKPSASESTEIAMYRVLCLVALGRDPEARQAIETIVRAEPEYRLSEAQASPRVRTMFESVRRPLLPDIVRDMYVKGREAFDSKDPETALKHFDRLIALVREVEPTEDQGLRDLRTLASGFRDLAKAALAPPPPPPEPIRPEPAAPPPAPKPDPEQVFSPADTDVTPPVAISQQLPPWRPETAIEQKMDHRGMLDLLVDEQGRVASAAIVRSVHPRYDPLLTDAARRWTFRPANKGGRPVRYRYTMVVNLVRR